MTPAQQSQIREAHSALPEGCRYVPATSEQLSVFEAEFGAIPADLRWFLGVCGGGIVGSERIDDITRLRKSHLKFRREAAMANGWKKKDVFVVGWDGSGNPMGIDQVTGQVVVEDHDFGGVHVIAGSFIDFLLQKR
ncbi:MAG TPA: SMI1/KNR4 family protein [Opitutaceae bacterium]|nr:SMI1/KNR4 family protein [Opitutaceae bacterium]